MEINLRSFGKRNGDIYLIVGIAELIAVCIMVIVRLVVTMTALNNGFVELNPVSVLGIGNFGFVVYGIIGMAILVAAFVVLYIIGKKASFPLLPVVSFGVIVIASTFDMFHDIFLLGGF